MTVAQGSINNASNVGGAVRAAPGAGVGFTPTEREIRRILDLSVPVSVVLAERDMTVKSVLAITVGTIIEFDVPFDADLTLQVGNHSIGSGQAVKAGENFGLRIIGIQDVHERIEALGGG
jgi:flagellar motor switch protein FliN/FliY